MTDIISAMPIYAAAQAEQAFVDFYRRFTVACEGDLDRLAVVDDQEAWTRRELMSLANRIANRLIENGLAKGDTVAVLAKNSNVYVALMVGTLAAGGCFVPLSGMASPETIRLMIEDCDTRFLFADPECQALLSDLPGPLGLVEGPNQVSLGAPSEGWLGLEQWLGSVSDGSPAIAIGPDDAFNIIYSSGTTGVPKGIVHDHRMRYRNLDRFLRLGFGSDTVTMIATPLYSNTTMVAALPTVAFGGLLVVMEKFEAGKYLELAQQYRATHTILVPVQYQRLVSSADFARYDLSSFKLKFSSGSPLRASVISEVMARWPGNLVEIYGMTEGGVSAMLNCAANPAKWDSVGQPSEGCTILLIDEQGRPVPQGEIGEIVGRATGMMRGYYKRLEASVEILWHDENGEAYYRSGDMGRFDEDGFLYVLDRKKDMIISGGFNIFAEDLERTLLAHPDVEDAAVIAIPSERWGETPLGLVVRAAGSMLDVESLLAWANERLGKAQRLAAIELRAELPRNPAGKLLKKELRAPYWAAARGQKTHQSYVA
ncbi:class I adenylate-forming enzyme family protein [Stutzerimonas tarimensis]|uniref:Class I adenylate-forming enzyme family protein n=1 Tax=Stutzerimonas tarimensis TaxID=1507735 RepID=A0ABV7T832_9GAMM